MTDIRLHWSKSISIILLPQFYLFRSENSYIATSRANTVVHSLLKLHLKAWTQYLCSFSLFLSLICQCMSVCCVNGNIRFGDSEKQLHIEIFKCTLYLYLEGTHDKLQKTTKILNVRSVVTNSVQFFLLCCW